MDKLRELLGGKIFGATFEKADGTIRSGAFRLGVDRTKGVGRNYDADARGNLIVWDMHAEGYRTIALERLISLRVQGREIVV